jgi:hypothetical protein
MSVNLDLLRRATDAPWVSPFAPFPEVLAPASARDYTQTPFYELPVFRTALKLTEIQGITGLSVARRIYA